MNRKRSIKKIFGSQKAFVLVTTMILLVTCLLGGSAYLTLSVNEVNLCKQEANSIKAFYLAESGLQKALYNIKGGNMTGETFRLSDISSGGDYLDGVFISTSMTNLGNNVYRITATCQVGNSSRSVTATALNQPPAKVFDYAYFINNWGWFYGSGITANGDVRSNGRFDFRHGPTVNGDIYAGQDIGVDGSGIKGKGGDEENQYTNCPRLDMPNLQDLSYYESLAESSGGNIIIDGNTIIDGVYGDDAGESGNMVLVGTPSKPIEINGPVVITGDVVIKGTVKGQGTIYSGRNIYFAGDVLYKNAPPSPRPASDDPSVVDNWVEAHKDDDLVAFCASGSVVVGDYTKSAEFGYTGMDRWYADGYVFDMGSEDVGRDGIPGTGDEDEDNGAFEPDYEDLDGDGEFDDNYSWEDIQTSVPISQFDNLPGGVASFSDIATNSLNRLDGVLYTDHSIAGRVGNGVQLNGAVISKDEVIIYRNNIFFNYDERLNSRYRSDANWLIDLKLPVAIKVKMIRWWE